VTRWAFGDHASIVQLFQTLIASLGSVLLFRLAYLLTGAKRIAVISALLFAVDPLLVKQASGPSELALSTTMVLAVACCFTSATTTAGMAMAGVLPGILILTRSMTLPLFLCGISLLLIAQRRKAAIAFAAGVFVVVAPLALRNQSVNGSWLPTRSGMNLYLGNSPYTAAAAEFYMRRRDWRRDALLWSIAATFVLVHAVYFPATRYRAPMEFVLLFYAAVAFARFGSRMSVSFVGKSSGRYNHLPCL
jgi:hypothetical protein